MTRVICLALLLTFLAPMSAAAQSDVVTVTLAEQNDSGISGSATLTQVGDDLRVEVTVTGSPTDGDHPAHIHTGTCPSPGSPIHTLENIVGGSSTTTLADVTLASVADGNHAINLHESAANMGASGYVTCGDIPEAEMAEATAPAATATSADMTSPTATAAVPAALPATGQGGASGSASWPLIAVVLFVAFAVLWPRIRSSAAANR